MSGVDGAEAGPAGRHSTHGRKLSATVIELPGQAGARRRLLASSILCALEDLGISDRFRVIECGPFQRVEIDGFAAVIMPCASPDFQFELRMNTGPRVLLITDDIAMMVDFVRQDGHARIGNSPALQGVL
jgi:hypothetical protein